jgi:hypothetical protein
MVISYIYLTCWCMKSMFYERQQWHALLLALVVRVADLGPEAAAAHAVVLGLLPIGGGTRSTGY